MKKWQEYEKWADLTTSYGAEFHDGKWIVKLWHPFAKKVDLIIYDKVNQTKIFEKIEGKFVKPNWVWQIRANVDGFFYHYEITQEDNKRNLALDPFAKSMAAFNWQGHEKNVGKAAFVKFDKLSKLSKLKKIWDPQPIIYEANIRDLTSLKKNVQQKGSYKAILEAKIGDYLKELNVTHIQFLPVHSCYTLDEKNKTILSKGQGSNWTTNYNWGYDPHNYFSLNGWYSCKPNDPYERIKEFKEVVKHFHENNIFVINDVVYNHMYDNSILNNVIPSYYFRENASQHPVNQPPLASEREMCRRIIMDSLKWYVEIFDVDGFRFDLSTFIDKETLNIISKELRKIKPHLVLHGEAWNWTDLKPTNSYNKGVVDNQNDFAYFNDTTRNAIKGTDEKNNFQLGLLQGNVKEFPQYLSSIIGNIKNFHQEPEGISKKSYDRFTNSPNNVLNYAACHDGHTLWDKINLTVQGNFDTKISYYRQALMMQTFLPGRTLYLQGTEMLYSKPRDSSGQDSDRFYTSNKVTDVFNLGKKYHENTYKTTDWTNGVRWNNLNDEKIKKSVFNFLSKLNKFRRGTVFFNFANDRQINQAINFNYVSISKKIVDFCIKSNKKVLRVIHNFSNQNHQYFSKGRIIFDSEINSKNNLGFSLAHSSVAILEN